MTGTEYPCTWTIMVLGPPGPASDGQKTSSVLTRRSGRINTVAQCPCAGRAGTAAAVCTQRCSVTAGIVVAGVTTTVLSSYRAGIAGAVCTHLCVGGSKTTTSRHSAGIKGCTCTLSVRVTAGIQMLSHRPGDTIISLVSYMGGLPEKSAPFPLLSPAGSMCSPIAQGTL
ncbi:MAG: hypothetical protein DDT20_01913 [Firmicutes bacterium]|nr:hypothetical protein [Bacillota bacterium]